MANCTFISPRTFSARAIASVWRFSSAMVSALQREGRQRAGAVAGVHAGLLDVLHHAGHEHRLAVAERVDVHLGGAAEVLVDQHRAVAGDLHGRRGCSGRAAPRRGRSPSPGRPARRRGGSPPGSRRGGRPRTPPRRVRAMALTGWAMPSRCSSCWNRSRSSARSMASGVVPRIGTPASSSGWASFSGVWPPNWTMTPSSSPLRLLDGDQLEHVLGGQRLEVEPVGGVVVGGDGLGVAVDHDRLDADLVEREGGVAAAVVELDALADAVGAAAEDDRLLAVRGLGLALGRLAERAGLVGRVHVGRRGARTRPAQVSMRLNTGRTPSAWRTRAHLVLGLAGELGQPRVGEAHAPSAGASPSASARQAVARAALPPRPTRCLDLAQEPGLVGAGGVDLLDARGRGGRPGRSPAGGRASACPARAGSRRGRSPDRRRRRCRSRRGRSGRSPARAAPSAGSRRRCGRWPSPRRPTSSRW